MAQRSSIKRFNYSQPTNVDNSGIVRNIDYNEAVRDITELYSMVNNIPAGPTGPQGPIGPQGVPGPVGPAGLNWQGAWSATGTYAVDDAVGYNGASWFCINPVGPSAVTPDVDTTNWALLAAQGATGPQGPQGIQGPQGPAGGTSIGTIGTVAATFVFPGTLLPYDINYITGSNGQMIQLPQNAPVGKEITIFAPTTLSLLGIITVKAFGGTNTIYNNLLNINQDFYYMYKDEVVKFISLGGNTWKSEYVTGASIIFNTYRLNPSNSYTIIETLENTTTSALSASQLNSTYNNVFYPVGLKVICKNIVGGGLMYIKTGSNTWVSSPITAVV